MPLLFGKTSTEILFGMCSNKDKFLITDEATLSTMFKIYDSVELLTTVTKVGGANGSIADLRIASELQCPTSVGQMNLARQASKATGFIFRCKTNKTHEVASRKFSFFEGSKLTIQDIMVFVKSYLKGHTLFMASKMSGVSYRSTAGDWGSFIRDLFKDHFIRSISHKVLKGNENINLNKKTKQL